MADVADNTGQTGSDATAASSGVRRLLGRLTPKSMAGRLIALLLATLVISQVVGLYFFFGERRQALQGVAVRNVLNRTMMVTGLIESTPRDLHNTVLRASSNRNLQFRIGDVPLVDASGAAGLERRLRNRLVDTIPGFRGQVRVRLSARPGVSAWRSHHRAEDGERIRDLPRSERRRERRRRRFRRLRWLQASVELGPDTWLNMRAAAPTPSEGPLLPFLATLGLMALSLGLAVAWAIRKITRPLQALGDAAQQMGRGEAVPVLPTEGPDELRNATEAFNNMNERVTRFVQDRTRMLAAISHDLRTPITTLRLRAEMLEPGDNRDKMMATLDEMQRMSEETLSFVKNEAKSEAARSTDLDALVSSVCSDLSEIGKAVEFEPESRTIIRCRPTSVIRAVRNLVENAVTYGSRAKVRVLEENGFVIIQVDDDGPGLEDDDLKQVFEPFYRVEPSRSRETGGAGLGLAIARSITRSHGGELTLKNLPQGGLRAEMTLPVA